MVTTTKKEQSVAACERKLEGLNDELSKIDTEYFDQRRRHDLSLGGRSSIEAFDRLIENRELLQRQVTEAREALAQARANDERKELDRVTPPRQPDAELDRLLAEEHRLRAVIREVDADPELASMRARQAELRRKIGGREQSAMNTIELESLGRQIHRRSQVMSAKRSDAREQIDRLRPLIELRALSLYRAATEPQWQAIAELIRKAKDVCDQALLIRRAYALDINPVGVLPDRVPFTDARAAAVPTKLAAVLYVLESDR